MLLVTSTVMQGLVNHAFDGYGRLRRKQPLYGKLDLLYSEGYVYGAVYQKIVFRLPFC